MTLTAIGAPSTSSGPPPEPLVPLHPATVEAALEEAARALPAGALRWSLVETDDSGTCQDAAAALGAPSGPQRKRGAALARAQTRGRSSRRVPPCLGSSADERALFPFLTTATGVPVERVVKSIAIFVSAAVPTQRKGGRGKNPQQRGADVTGAAAGEAGGGADAPGAEADTEACAGVGGSAAAAAAADDCVDVVSSTDTPADNPAAAAAAPLLLPAADEEPIILLLGGDQRADLARARSPVTPLPCPLFHPPARRRLVGPAVKNQATTNNPLTLLSCSPLWRGT